jgi:hypothetical protein
VTLAKTLSPEEKKQTSGTNAISVTNEFQDGRKDREGTLTDRPKAKSVIFLITRDARCSKRQIAIRTFANTIGPSRPRDGG